MHIRKRMNQLFLCSYLFSGVSFILFYLFSLFVLFIVTYVQNYDPVCLSVGFSLYYFIFHIYSCVFDLVEKLKDLIAQLD